MSSVSLVSKYKYRTFREDLKAHVHCVDCSCMPNHCVFSNKVSFVVSYCDEYLLFREQYTIIGVNQLNKSSLEHLTLQPCRGDCTAMVTVDRPS